PGVRGSHGVLDHVTRTRLIRHLGRLLDLKRRYRRRAARHSLRKTELADRTRRQWESACHEIRVLSIRIVHHTERAVGEVCDIHLSVRSTADLTAADPDLSDVLFGCL